MRDFLFAPEQARTPLRVLSGGERGRLMLARALAKPSNLLVLDEPTNDLDLETLDVLEDMLGDYAGTVILISHDRDFLDRVVNARDRAGGRRSLGGICRRLFRHAGAARRRYRAQAGQGEKSSPSPKEIGRLRQNTTKRRLTFNDKHALETLPKRIAHCRREFAKLQKQLDDPDLYARDRAAFSRATGGDGGAAQAELAAAEEKWLELEILREEIEGG